MSKTSNNIQEVDNKLATSEEVMSKASVMTSGTANKRGGNRGGKSNHQQKSLDISVSDEATKNNSICGDASVGSKKSPASKKRKLEQMSGFEETEGL